MSPWSCSSSRSSLMDGGCWASCRRLGRISCCSGGIFALIVSEWTSAESDDVQIHKHEYQCLYAKPSLIILSMLNKHISVYSYKSVCILFCLLYIHHCFDFLYLILSHLIYYNQLCSFANHQGNLAINTFLTGTVSQTKMLWHSRRFFLRILKNFLNDESQSSGWK